MVSHTERGAAQTWGHLKDVFFRFLRFVTVGVVNTAVELVVYNLLLVIHNPHNLKVLTVYSTAGVVAAIANSYLLNSRWAFRGAKAEGGTSAMRQRLLFIAQALVNIGINDAVTVAITPLLTNADFLPLQVAQNLAKVVAMATSSASSFMMLSWFVFNSQSSPSGSAEPPLPLDEEEPVRHEIEDPPSMPKSIRQLPHHPHHWRQRWIKPGGGRSVPGPPQALQEPDRATVSQTLPGGSAAPGPASKPSATSPAPGRRTSDGASRDRAARSAGETSRP